MEKTNKDTKLRLFIFTEKIEADNPFARPEFPIKLVFFDRDAETEYKKYVMWITLGQARELKEKLEDLVRDTEEHFQAVGWDEEEMEEMAKFRKE